MLNRLEEHREEMRRRNKILFRLVIGIFVLTFIAIIVIWGLGIKYILPILDKLIDILTRM